MSAVAVEIRTATDGQTEVVRETPVMCFDRGVMVAVPGLDGGEAGAGQPRHQIVAAGQSGMCQGRDPAGGADHRYHFRRTRARSGDEARTATSDQPGEGVSSIDRMSRHNESVGDMRTADAGASLALFDERPDIDIASQRVQAFRDRTNPAYPIGSLCAKKL